MFNGPIPGESLTKPPKNFPWERPPEINDPEEVVQMYLSKLTDSKRMEGIMDALEIGMTVKDVTEGILRVGVANGIHSIDVSLLAAPVIHDYIVGVADELGIEYDEGFEDKEQEEKDAFNKRYLKAKVRLEKRMSKKNKASQSTTEAYEKAGSEGMGTPTQEEPMAPEMAPEAPAEDIAPLIPRRVK